LTRGSALANHLEEERSRDAGAIVPAIAVRGGRLREVVLGLAAGLAIGSA